VCRRPKQDGGNDPAREHTSHEGVGRFERDQIHKKDAADCAEHRDAAKDERISDRCRRVGESERADQNRADQAHGVSFKNVCRHARAIADVIAHIVSNRGRVTWVVFLQAALDFADQVGAYVSRLGVNAASKSRENTDQARAER